MLAGQRENPATLSVAPDGANAYAMVTPMLVLVRALVYSALFTGFLLVFVPARILAATGIAVVPASGPWRAIGMTVTVLGAAIAFWCILTLVVVGQGTPAPFDPPRRLVIRGPCRFVRNPMYLGAGLALFGTAVAFQSVALLGYAVAFLLTMQAFIVLHEEPALRQAFGADYIAYSKCVCRWFPRF